MKFIYFILVLSVLKATRTSAWWIFPIDVDPTNGVEITDPRNKVTDGDPACKNCTEYVKNNIELVKPFILKMFNNQNETSFGPCSYCSVSGVDTIHTFGDACVTRVANQPNQTDTKLALVIDEYRIKCFCDLANSLSGLQKNLAGFTTNSQETCVPSTSAVGQIGTSTTEGVTAVGQLVKLTTLTSCLDLGDMAGTSKVEMLIKKTGFKFIIIVRQDKNQRGPKSTWVEDVRIIDKKYENMDIS